MTNTKNVFEIEFNIKLKMNGYRMKFVTKKAWIVSIVIILIRVATSYYADAYT